MFEYMNYLKSLVFILFLTVQLCVAQKTSEDIIHQYFDTIAVEGMSSIAYLIHPDELRRFRETIIPTIELIVSSNSLEGIYFMGFLDLTDSENPNKMKDLTDEEFLNTFMESMQLLTSADSVLAYLKNAKIETLGYVVEDDLRHIVTKVIVTQDNFDTTLMSLLSFKDYNGEPRLMLPSEISLTANALRRSILLP